MSTTVEYAKESIVPSEDVIDETVCPNDGSRAAFFSDPARVKLQQEKLKQLVAELEADYGPVSAERLQWAIEQLTS